MWCQVDRGQTHKGAVPDKEESCSPFLYYQSQQLEARVLAKQRPLRLPSVYLMSPHVTKSPRPSPPYLHTASDQRLGVGKAWEWGYMCAWHILSMWISIWHILSMWVSLVGIHSVCAPVLHICVPHSSAHGWLMWHMASSLSATYMYW